MGPRQKHWALARVTLDFGDDDDDDDSCPLYKWKFNSVFKC
jgi:hypothetical protein